MSHVARVKGETENALLRLPFKAAYMFRPGTIQPLHGIKSKTKVYRLLYSVVVRLIWVMKVFMPNLVTTTEQVGRAMVAVAERGAPKSFLETKDINCIWKRHEPTFLKRVDAIQRPEVARIVYRSTKIHWRKMRSFLSFDHVQSLHADRSQGRVC